MSAEKRLTIVSTALITAGFLGACSPDTTEGSTASPRLPTAGSTVKPGESQTPESPVAPLAPSKTGNDIEAIEITPPANNVCGLAGDEADAYVVDCLGDQYPEFTVSSTESEIALKPQPGFPPPRSRFRTDQEPTHDPIHERGWR